MIGRPAPKSPISTPMKPDFNEWREADRTVVLSCTCTWGYEEGGERIDSAVSS